MTFTILKNRHWARPWKFAVWWKKNKIVRRVIFHKNCAYNLGDDDQEDINKLFGIAYLALQENPHHVDSARFGWNYNLITEEYDIWAYCYVNGKLVVRYLCTVKSETSHTLSIIIYKNFYFFSVSIPYEKEILLATDKVLRTHNKKLGFYLGTYFGGNQAAPHKMTIEISKLKK